MAQIHNPVEMFEGSYRTAMARVAEEVPDDSALRELDGDDGSLVKGDVALNLAGRVKVECVLLPRASTRVRLRL